MKTTPKIPPTAKAPHPVPTPATDTHTTPSQPSSGIPTLETFAALAATMASPTEEPELTVNRAIRLLVECREQYCHLVRQLETVRRLGNIDDSVQTERRVFLARCGLSPRDIELALSDAKRGVEIRVPLSKFLNGCKLRTESKSDYMTAEWRAYREQLVKRPGMSQSNLLDAVNAIMRTDRENGFSISDVWNHHRMFMDFLVDARRAKRSEASKKGGRPKKPLGAVKKARKTPQVRRRQP